MNDIMRGVLGGLAEEHAKNQQNLLTQEIDRRRQLADFWKSKADDPNDHPEARDVASQKRLAILQTPPGKKLPKEVESLDDWLNVQPKKGQSIPSGPQMQFGSQDIPHPPMEFAGGGTGSMGAPAQLPPTTLPAYSMEAPTPPPEIRVPHGYSDQEISDRAYRAKQVENEAALDLERKKTPIIAERGYQEAEAKRRSEQSPEAIEGTRKLKAAERGPQVVAQGAKVYDSEFQNIIARGDPKDRDMNEKLYDTAAQMVAQKHGLKLDVAPGTSAFDALPPALQSEATLFRAQMDDTVESKELKRLQMLAAQQSLAESSLRLKELQSKNDPKRLDMMAELVRQNPDNLDQLGTDKEKVMAAMQAKGYAVPRRPLTATEHDKELNAQASLDHVQVVRDILKQYPDIIGPVVGRAGEAEEKWGQPVFDFNKDPQRAVAEQFLRTSLKYLIARDLQALTKGRPAITWLNELKDASPNVKQALPFMEGALKGVEVSNQIVLNGLDRLRYGNQTGVPPRGAEAAAPAEKIATRKDVEDYAKVAGPGGKPVPYAQAEQWYKDHGYTIR